MQNFNTNQTRHLYVADAINPNVENIRDIALGTAETGEMYFKYKNSDGLVSCSDHFLPSRIRSLKKTAAADMARPLMMHTVKIDTGVVTLTDLVGKTLDCIITISERFDFDMANSVTFVASVACTTANTASEAEFHKALAIAIFKAMPRYTKAFPLIKVFSSGTEVTDVAIKADSVTGDANGVVLVEGLQKYVRGKLSGEPCPFSVAFRMADGNLDDIVWGTDTVEKSNIADNEVIPANYILSDLEYFALGERGDYYRGFMFPNDYTPTYAIDPFGTKEYDVLSIEFYWQGNVENVQKSPRLIQVAGAAADIATLYSTIEAAMPK